MASNASHGKEAMNANETFASLNQQAVDTALRLSRLSLDGCERVVTLQMNFARNSLAAATKNARAAAQAKDVQELLQVRATATEGALERVAGYSRELYEVASNAQSELSKIAEERMASLQQAVAETVDQAAKGAPGGSDVAVAAMKSSMAAATAAFDTFTKAARHATSFTDAGVKAASAAKRK
jgi:phasin family protein